MSKIIGNNLPDMPWHRKRPVVAPGEMEELKLKKADLLKYPDLKTITIKIEEA